MKEQTTARIHLIQLFAAGEPYETSLERYQPEDPEHFGTHIQLWIASSDAGSTGWPVGGADDFDLTVCTPSWFADRAEEDWKGLGGYRGPGSMPASIIMGHGIWFVQRWDHGEILAGLASIFETEGTGPDWGSVASRIGRYIQWDLSYAYDQHVNEHFGEPFPPPRP